MKENHACSFCGETLNRYPTKSGRVFCDTKCKAEWQKQQRPVTVEWLRQKYLVEGLDANQIARLVGRNGKAVWNWLKGSGIPTRPRGGYTLPHCFKKGQVNPFKGRHHSEETKARLSAIAKADGRVPFDPEIGSYMKGKNGANHPGWKGGVTAERQSVYSSPQWKRAVKVVWKRDNATCQKCGKLKRDNRDLPFDIHHIKSFECKTLRCRASNLVLLCEPCHYWVHSKNNEQNLFICR